MTISKSSKQAEALKYAHDIRKFEIDVYWRRAAYFWTFIAAAFGAFFLLEKTGTPKQNRDFSWPVLGLYFSVVWSLANCGSKYWQDNCEHTSIFLRMKLPARFTRCMPKDLMAYAQIPVYDRTRAANHAMHEHVFEAVQQRLDENPQAMRVRRETVEHPFGTRSRCGWVRRTF
jgi:hypothetical protein